MHIPFFRIWYSSTYTAIFIVLICLLCATPADHIYQSFRNSIIKNIFVVGGVYVLTALLAFFIYTSRLYTNRSVLSSIPKAYVPIETGELGKKVRRMIVKQLERSAIIAWESRPRDLRAEAQNGLVENSADMSSVTRKNGKLVKRRSHLNRHSLALPISSTSPPWGHISHPGWSSPASPDLPDLQYTRIVPELPNLIEAKAVSLAPPDPWLTPFENGAGENLVPDARLVALLQRPLTMGMREYMAHLGSLGVVDPPELAADFLTQYEHARFSTRSLTEKQFRSLMDVFSQLLSGMKGIDPAALEELQAAESRGSETSSLSPSEIASATRRHAPMYTDTQLAVDFGSSLPQHSISVLTARTTDPRSGSSARRDVSPTASTISSGSVRIHPMARTRTNDTATTSSSVRSGGSVIRNSALMGTADLPYRLDLDRG